MSKAFTEEDGREEIAKMLEDYAARVRAGEFDNISIDRRYDHEDRRGPGGRLVGKDKTGETLTFTGEYPARKVRNFSF